MANPNGKNDGGQQLDEGLYSRQLYVLGKEAMGRMASARILISGLGGLGVEVAKNVILGGVRSVTLHDQKSCSWLDMSSQYYLSPDAKNNVAGGVNRAEASLRKLSELNPYVKVDVYSPKNSKGGIKSLSEVMSTTPEDLRSNFDLIVITDYYNHQSSNEFSEILELSEFCHREGIKFILSETRGVFARVFVDFGNEFTIVDPNGEAPVTAMISMVTKEEKATVTCLDETRHGLEDGDSITFSEVIGLDGINSREVIAKVVEVTGPYTFKTDLNTLGFGGEYLKGGSVTQVKIPKRVSFRSLRDFLLLKGINGSEDVLCTDFGKFDHIPKTLLAFNAFARFSRLPKISPDESEEAEFLRIAKEIHQDNSTKGSAPNGAPPSGSETMEVDEIENRTVRFAKFDEGDFDEEFMRQFFYSLNGNLIPMNNFIGGVVAQEVMKGISGKFTPLKQFLLFDAIEILQIHQKLGDKTDKKTKKIKVDNFENRYVGQTCLFGEEFQNRLNSAKIFVVGAGAIGCELLKNFAMMGIAGSSKGQLIITDMDLIEKSNLNRQFLFRPENVGQAKSSTAAAAAREMNANLNIRADNNRVGPETEGYYDDEFFGSLDLVANALDNVDARIYMDRRCVYYRKPLLESGTLGTKGNCQIVIPHVTESYGSSQDPPEKSIPICTLKNFPNAIEHTLQWARDLFEGIFKQQAENAALYLTDDKFIERTLRLPGSQPLELLEGVRRALVDDRPRDFRDCVRFARLFYEEQFVNQIRQLLFNFPPDQLTSSGASFWSGPKRCPKPIPFVGGMEIDEGVGGMVENGEGSSTHTLLPLEFIFATANLRAEMYGIPQVRDMKAVEEIAKGVDVPLFTPRAGVRIATTEAEAQQMGGNGLGGENVEDLKGQLERMRREGAFTGLKVTPLEFEKDDDGNLHMDFIVAASNTRALNYGIQTADRLKSKLIAGKIIPAIATTTSVVAGLVALELYKVMMIDFEALLAEKKLRDVPNLEQFKNGFVNLALPFFGFSEPIRCTRSKYYEHEWSLWDRFEVSGDLTLREFIDYFKNEHGLEITMMSQGVCMLYSFFMAVDKRKERMEMPIVEVVRQVSKRSLEPHVKALVFELCCNDNDGEDVEVPYVRYIIPDKYLH